MTPEKRREVFERVRTHLLTQGRRAGNDQNCFYRTEDGLRCAIGCLISDKHYHPRIEGLPVSNGDVIEAVFLSLGGVPFDQDDLGMFEELQTIHDDRFSPMSWPRRLADLDEELTEKDVLAPKEVQG